MRKQDLLNAIDEVDLKYVTQAWENTQPSTDEKQHLGDKHHGRLAAFGAGIAATLLIGFVAVTYMRGNPRLSSNSGGDNSKPAGIAPGVSVSAQTSEPPESSDSAVTSIPKTESTSDIGVHEVLQGTLYGPDKQTFTYNENDGESTITKDGTMTTITYDDFVYLGEPKNTYNSFMNPSFFVPHSEAFGGVGVANHAMLKLYEQEVPYRRFYVGEKYGDLTLRSAKTTFLDFDRHSDSANVLTDMVLTNMRAEFDGTTKMPVIIYCYDDVYFAIPFSENVPTGGGNQIPVMSFLTPDNDGGYMTTGALTPITADGSVMAHTDVVIRLNNPEAFGLADMISEKGYAIVFMELGDVVTEYSDSSSGSGKREVDLTTAAIVDISQLGRDFSAMRPESTTDPYTTIENYFRAYVADTRFPTDDYKLLSANPIAKSDEEIRDELSRVNPGAKPLNPDCAELIQDYEVMYFDGENNVTATCRLIYDKSNTNVWTVISSRTISSEQG